MAGIRERKYKGKSKPYYEISWYVDGKQYKKGGFRSKTDAQIELAKFVNTENKNIKFCYLAQDYINRHCKLNCKSTTKKLYESYLNNNLDAIKLKIAQDIKRRDIENIILDLKGKLSNKTINCIITFVQAVMNYGVENDLLRHNPIARFRKLPLIKSPIHFLNEQQMDVFLTEAKNLKPPFYTFFATAIFTGMRISEIAGLEWSDIDFKRKTITVNKQIYRGVKQPTKTNKERVIDIPDNLVEILQNHKIENTYLTKLVFHNGKGEPIHTCSMKEHHFHPLIKRCNQVLDADNQIIDFRFHDLRHTYASYLLSNGVPIKYVQEQLGHSSCKMTLDVYASVMPSVKFDALNLLEKVSKNSKKEQNKNIKIYV